MMKKLRWTRSSSHPVKTWKYRITDHKYRYTPWKIKIWNPKVMEVDGSDDFPFHFFCVFLKVLRVLSPFIFRGVFAGCWMEIPRKESKNPDYQGSYFWWKKSCTSWYGKYPIIYRVLYIPGGAGFLPSTVFHPFHPPTVGCLFMSHMMFSFPDDSNADYDSISSR